MTTLTPSTLSVVIPVKDDAARLEHCLEALWQQTRRPDEIVVVDNGSSDLTSTVAGWWGVVYVREDRPGIAAAASAGYDAATGDVIARLDADSVPPPTWVASVGSAMAGDEGPDAVTGPGRFDSLPSGLATVADVVYMGAYFRVFGRVVGHTPLFGSNFAMRREVWLAARDATHRDDPEVHDDLDLSFSLPRSTRVDLDPRLTLSISARPFADPRAFGRRIRRGAHTVVVNRPVRAARAGLAALLAADGIGVAALTVGALRAGAGPARVLAGLAAGTWALALAGIPRAMRGSRPTGMARGLVVAGLVASAAGSAALGMKRPSVRIPAAGLLLAGAAVSTGYLFLLRRLQRARDDS